MTTERVDIIVREDGSRVVQRNLAAVGDEADKTADSLDNLKRIFAGLAIGAAVTAMVRLADQFTNVQNRLRLVTTGTENLGAVTKELGRIANQTRSDFFATAELYSRMATSAKELGVSQRDLLGFTKSVNQAIILSGASAEEAAGGIRQLAQGMASGTLRGDELNSVLENLPAVADIIAKGLGVTRGELRKMGAEGKVTARDIISAFQEASTELETNFGKTVPTVGQAFTVMRNNFVLMLGELDKSYGITAGLSKAILAVAENLDKLLPIIMGVGAAIAVAFAPTIIAEFALALKGLWLIVLANPFTAIAAAVAGVAVAIYGMRDSIKLGIDDTTTLGHLLSAIWEQIVPAIDLVAEYISKFFKWVLDSNDEVKINFVKNGEVIEEHGESTWLQVTRAVARAIDAILGLLIGLQDAAMRIFGAIAGAVGAMFSNAAKQLGQVMEGDFKGAIETGLNQVDVLKKAGEIMGNALGEGLDTGFGAMMEGGLESKLDKAIKRAQELSKIKPPGGDGINDFKGEFKPPAIDDKGKAAKELKKLQDELDALLNKINPVRAAQMELKNAEELLTKAVAKGLITRTEANSALAAYTVQMKEQLQPYEFMLEQMKEDQRISQLLGVERELEINLLGRVNQLKQAGITVTKEMTDELRAQLVVEQELNKIAQMKETLLANTRGMEMGNFQTMITAIKDLTADPESGFGMVDGFEAANAAMNGLFDGTQQQIANTMMSYQMMREQVEVLTQEGVISEQTASQARIAIWQMEQQTKLAAAKNTLGTIALLMNTNSKKAFQIGKAAAIAQAGINTYEGATAAFKSAANIPYVGWILAPIAAGAAIAAGMAQVQQIRSQQMPAFRTGGSMTIGGSGGIDSQTVAFRGTPGEKVSVNTPAQARALERAGDPSESAPGRRGRTVHQTVNVYQQGKPDRKTVPQTAREVRNATVKQFERG